MIILGTLFPENREKEIISASKKGVSNAGNSFQWNMIKGITDCSDESVTVINALPVGTWPRNYRRLLLGSGNWEYGGVAGHEVGCVNLPVIKQIQRMLKIRALLRKHDAEENILIFTAYLPALWAVNGIEKNKQVTAVITDIPEFYDMHAVSRFRSLLRKLHCRLVYRFMVRVDRFVLLTEQMKEPLRVGDRPYMVMEGICGDMDNNESAAEGETFSLLYTGRLNRRYGLGLLLEAMRQLEDPDIELWLCGSGEMEQEIRQYAKHDPRVRFFGFMPHEETLRMQKRASVLVNPRTSEGEYTKYSFPSKTMEYMAAGRPVMMFRLAGVPSEYDEFLTYIPEESAAAISDTIHRLKSMSAAELTRIGEKGRSFVLTYKSRQNQMRRVMTFMGLTADRECERK